MIMKIKLSRVLLVVIITLLIALAGYIFYVARAGIPKTSGTISADVSSEVEIYRDDYGTPHIIATTMEDLFFGQGYAQAQDRLWQMDMNRRGVAGKLSEILGEDMIETDLFTLTVGFYRAAEKNYELMGPEIRKLFDAYCAGVNAYIEDNHSKLSPEFTLIGYKPEPWTTLDSLAIGVYMSWYLGGNMQSELFNSALIQKVGIDLAMEIFPDYPDYGPTVIDSIHDYDELTDEEDLTALIELSRIAELNGQTRYVPGLGSNNWVISGDLTPGQGALLANDMHLAMGLPSIWHTAHLILEDELNVTGVMFPGVPGIVVGFNEDIAWGFTNTGPDVQDLYRLELNPENPHQYLYMGKWLDADIIVEEIMVKGEDEPRQIEVMETHFGPVISNVVDLDIPFSLRWTALEGTTEFEAIIEYMGASNWEEFTTALEKFKTPTQNMVYADREGNIGLRANGLIPIRGNGTGLLPADGTTDEYEWIGYIPYDELPTLYNPPEGIIVTANHQIVDDNYPYFITDSWAPPYRAMGIWKELEGKDTYILEDMIAPQTSFFNSQAEILGPVMVNALKSASLNDKQAEVLKLFEEWLTNPVETAEAIGPTLYNTLYYYMLGNTFADEMGEDLYERFLHNRASTNAFDRMILSGESGWFNNIETLERETRDDIIFLSFIDAIAYLEETLGTEPAEWWWGNLHTFTLKHNMGSVDLLARFFNRGPYPVGGSFHTPANMSYLLTDPYQVTHSAPWRYMVDLNDHRAFDVLAGGSSGHLYSNHYNDQTELWLAGEYKEMIFYPDDVRALSELLILEPK
jgi:penicillin G amidase